MARACPQSGAAEQFLMRGNLSAARVFADVARTEAACGAAQRSARHRRCSASQAAAWRDSTVGKRGVSLLCGQMGAF